MTEGLDRSDFFLSLQFLTFCLPFYQPYEIMTGPKGPKSSELLSCVFISTQTNVYTHTGSRFQNVQNYSYFLDYCAKSVSSLSRSFLLPSDSLSFQKNKINQLTTLSSCYGFFLFTISKGGSVHTLQKC